MSIDIIPDGSGAVIEWVRKGLGYDNDWPKDKHLTFGFYYNKKLVGALVFHELRRRTEVWWTMYSTDKHWCSRKVLRLMFTIAFCRMDCRRIGILVSKSNVRCLSMVRRLGFKDEGIMRQCRDDGEDCYIFGMLRSECPWVNFNGEKNE